PPKIEEPEIVIPDSRGPGDDDTTKPDTGSSGESQETEPAEQGIGRDVLAAKPDAAPEVEVAADLVPRKIPDTIQPPAPPSPPPAKPDAPKPAGTNKTVRGSGAELFDTQGFPMGEYQDIVVERVRANWMIPSNLRNSFGRTAVVFYIDINGRVTDLRVESSSGNNSLDSAALSAVWSAVPFPSLPKGFPRERVGVRLFLTYEP
ncbi:MAG: TonB C-terminal domain-containing protein, partial [Acidobacteria bacterium]|nr:TonB C-terminal domain-containing protein [Acidobacteriota bacterium]